MIDDSHKFELKAEYKPKGSQPEAIKKLVDSIKNKNNFQTLLGVTGSGKTFTMANVIEKVQKPTLVLAPNKTLAAQLYNEFKEFFPNNRVEYFVSYYDFYQPESYIPQKDLYIEKDAQINSRIEMMRLAATASLQSRKDTIVVASVSCIYGLGNPEHFENLGFEIKKDAKFDRDDMIRKFISILYERNDTELSPGRFRVKGDTIDIVPGYMQNIIRIEFFGDKIESISELDKVTHEKLTDFEYFFCYPARHFVIPEEEVSDALENIEHELEKRLPQLDLVERQRLKQRTKYDLEMIRETGHCKGIENYSRHFDKRNEGEKPYVLLDYFGDDFLVFLDESHQSVPQVHGMYKGDRARKLNLVEYGFRLPSALDNRPLMYAEFEKYLEKNSTVFVSATPMNYEIEKSKVVAEQIIRPTGLVDPKVFLRPINGQIEDLKTEIKKSIKNGDRVLVTTLTKKLAEELTNYLAEQGIKTRYLHSEIDTLERTEIIRELRLGKFDCLVGINLLREGLDIPEVGFIGILDADKEGFLRNARSLIQIIGRAARNPNACVVLYGDRVTDSIKSAMDETKRRRTMQLEYNKKNNITPEKLVKPIRDKEVDIKDTKHIPKKEIPNLIIELEADMKEAANNLDFEKAIALRDKMTRLKKDL